MKIADKEIIELLDDLKNNHGAIGLKVELEDEGASFKDLWLAKRFCLDSDLDLSVKIGGCGALNDLNEIKNLGAGCIVAPMIESSYAVKKFIQSIKKVYAGPGNYVPKLFINIETIAGYKNMEEILLIPESEEISGIVIGCFDLAKSIGLECKDTNGEEIFKIVNDLTSQISNSGKKIIIGGGISADSINFLNRLNVKINNIETRKVIFDAQSILENKDFDALLKAIKFEILWLNLTQKDSQRINILKNRHEKLLKQKQQQLVTV